jgi:hypothetical protein
VRAMDWAQNGRVHLVDDNMCTAGLLQSSDGFSAATNDATDDTGWALDGLGGIALTRHTHIGDQAVDLGHSLLDQVGGRSGYCDVLQVAGSRVVDLRNKEPGMEHSQIATVAPVCMQKKYEPAAVNSSAIDLPRLCKIHTEF